MRKLLVIMLSLFVVSSVAFAKPTAQLDFATMSKADTQFLFQDGAKVATLDKAEMSITSGKAIWFAPFAWAAFRVAITGFTRHGLNQAINRASTRAINYTMKNATRAYSDIARRTTRYESRRGVVILNQAGRVVSTWRWSR